MIEHPIIFSTDMVKAIVDGRKTQTRRVVNKQTSSTYDGVDWAKFCWDGSEIHKGTFKGEKDRNAPLPWVDNSVSPKYNIDHYWLYLHIPYNWAEHGTIYRVYPKWQVGDGLWVKETHYLYGHWEQLILHHTRKTGVAKQEFVCDVDRGCKYQDNPPSYIQTKHSQIGWFKRPSIFMPRWASRINLEITGVRVERVQYIKYQDIWAEGCSTKDMTNIYFKDLWDKINAKRGYGWEANPWVWVIDFSPQEVKQWGNK